MTRRRAKQKESRGATRLSPKPRDSQRFPQINITLLQRHFQPLSREDEQAAILRLTVTQTSGPRSPLFVNPACAVGELRS